MLAPLLDDQPDVLVPRAALLRRRALARSGGPVGVSRAWRIAGRDGRRTVEVEDPTLGTVSEFALTSTSLDLLGRLVPGERAPALDPMTEDVLVDAGVLAAPRGNLNGHADVLSTARASFAADRYAVVPDVLHPYDVAAVRRYVRAGARSGRFPFGEQQGTRRYHSHNDPMLRVCQHRLLPLAAAIVGVAIKPSYVYLSAYTEGAVLPPHRDREQCEYTITLQVDYTPEPALEAGWPIRMTLPDTEVTVYQSLGDALLFAGREHPHFRDPLPPGHTSTSLLLHYVDADFEGSLE
jgi:hypothetical protein